MSANQFIIRPALVGAVLLACSAAPALAVPSFADQTGQPCQACHVGGFEPQLTTFGRDFKLRGYTLRTKPFNLPISAMVVASYVNISKEQATPSADSFGVNNNVALDQASIFLAGGIGSHFGGFVQTTYDGTAKTWTWDNVDLRAVGTGQIKGADLVYGVSINNSPGTQDAWNTLPAWGYPYTSSALAPSPATSPLISGGLAQSVIGATAYAWIDSKSYVEAGGYSTPKAGTLSWLGADPFSPGDIKGLAPYGRISYQKSLGGGTFEIGAFGLRAALHPGRDRTTPFTDHFTDLGLDASWIKTFGSGDTFTANSRYTHEKFLMDATCAIGIADGSFNPPFQSDCAKGHLDDFRADISYYWHNKIGATVGMFNTSGSANPWLYANNSTFKPDSTGIMWQVDATPFDGENSPLGHHLNLRVGAQYMAYTRFNGARHNYGGSGADASDNNTARIFAWFAF